ncbi:SH2 domain-containing protein 1A-like isoform X1 [Cheilinus undulatus]|uniref:SH2 domain-containing protein 1A-like isoform X1 n=1 Tax=Cheilinus undulatus TaxID=241271 RepID=UPI001BD56D94|nr:SH2 domain-containing protein 1A-like isoform X1 [Cheilinus undulatus]
MGACIRGSMESEGMLPRSIYYGRIGSEGTERLLERFGHDGSFLLRDSETVPGVFCLCVRKTPFVYTYRLVHSSDGWFLQLQGSGVRKQTFRTLEMLIENYRRDTSDVSIAPLTEPLDRTRVHNFSSGQEFIYMETCNSSRGSSVC